MSTRMFRCRVLVIAAALGLLLACGGSEAASPAPTAAPPTTGQEGGMTFTLQSSAFAQDQPIPIRYTCDADNISPDLTWSGMPEGTASFALLVDDPDAPRGVFTHWVLFDLPATQRQLPEAVPPDEEPETGGVNGQNGRGELGYIGPCPPPGTPHHYHFSLYALDAPLDLPPGSTKQQVLDEMEGHVLAQAQLIGTYQRAE